MEAKLTEIRDVINKATLRAVFGTKSPDGESMISYGKILAIKLDREKCKARCVFGGHLDIMVECLVHGAQTIQNVSIHFFIAVKKIRGFIQ